MSTDQTDAVTSDAPLDPEVFPPTLREVMLRPRWLAMLAFCLVVAGIFAWLGQWQLARALDTAPTSPGQTEHVIPIDQAVKPGAYLNAPLVGQRVRVDGHFVAGDFLVVAQRINKGVEGYWVTGQLRISGTTAPTSVAVAVGWAPTVQKAHAAASALNDDPGAAQTVTGRLISDEGPVVPPSGQPYEMTTMSTAALLSRWHDIAGLDVYRPFLVSEASLGGLTVIASHPPEVTDGPNWLNLFYAAEWAVFAGFAFYLWYRLAKDAWEKDVEELTGGGDDPDRPGGEPGGEPEPGERGERS